MPTKACGLERHCIISLVVKVKIHTEQMSLVDPHELGDESFEVEDDLGAHANAVFVEGTPLYDLRFQSIIELRHELEGERL